MKIQAVVLLLICLLSITVRADVPPGQITVNLQQPGPRISPIFYGLMTEEINHSYDGGLYAELVQNRIFQDNAAEPRHWSVVKTGDTQADIALDENNPIASTVLTRCLRLDITSIAPGQQAGIANDGYWGIPVRPHTQYRASFFAKAGSGFSGPLTAEIQNSDGTTVYASASVPAIDTQWKKYELTLTTPNELPPVTGRFVILAQGQGSVWFNLVSLFPPTFANRPNGNRIDLMQLLADLHPAFLRFPGGNYLEGNTIDERFAWKKTIGDLSQRPGHRGPWGYRSSDGLGLLEFFDWCQDLHMQPLLAVYAGYSLRGQHIDPGPALEPFVQNALDEIEYATGDDSTKWGHQRALDGHPAPFKIEYVEIGNEDQFDRSGSYDGRFAQFHDAIKAKYPDLKLIATTPVHSRTPDVVDDHYYRSARAMELDVHHYDKYNRSGPKIFVGEWATTEGTPTPDMNAALADAAWLTGLERNSDVVIMSAYAPLLVNVNTNARQWGTNLIGYDALSSFGSASYYAQQMFSQNLGDTVLPVDIQEQPHEQPPAPAPAGRIGVGTWQTSAEFKDIKVTHGDDTLFQSDFAKGTSGWRPRGGTWETNGADAALTQTAMRDDCRDIAGDNNWADYTYSLKARKLGGNEGFLIAFHVRGRNDYVWWNLGGWGNTRTALEQSIDGEKTQIGPSAPVTIQPNQWYDIRIELQGRDIKCFLDNKLIIEASESSQPPLPAVYATASRVDATGQVILKVVNASASPQQLQINLRGATEVDKNATVQVLTGDPKDVNTIEQPRKIYPRSADITDAAASFTHEFPADSVSVLKLSVK
ncbi:MAG TPA: alpha-L-arabinofuranosidase C-terminal domain-containing protein [Tepidisphaeraceae bacterium]|jgi:alpha-L-arabinofuranosidase|nr:alpha-L-arabinofuranosidase C-terminal domain-containing protein [Tepidisphaeraceae bacterium]